MSYICGVCRKATPKGQQQLTNEVRREVVYRNTDPETQAVKRSVGYELVVEIPVCEEHQRPPIISGSTKVVDK